MAIIDKVYKHKNLIIVAAFCLLTAIALAPLSLGWFSNSGNNDVDFEAHAISGYFESGTGTEGDPYIISNAYHLYNLAWLQNLGKFTTDTYFELKEGIGSIDVAGQLDGTTGKSGAIPPIGSTKTPFVGHFDGNGVVIKNLWVSTDPADWYEQPYDVSAYDYASSTDVGLFGNVAYGANITNFYVENIEVTNTISGTAETPVNLGIVAGYVDGNISNIGVKNAKFSFNGKNTTNINSEYSLIGSTSDYVKWEDLPPTNAENDSGDDGGGDLIVNPATLSGSITTTVKIDGGVDAYLVSSLTRNPAAPPAKKFYKYTAKPIVFNSTPTVYSTEDGGMTQLNLGNAIQMEQLEIEKEFVDFFGAGSEAYHLMPGGAPGGTNGWNSVDKENPYPANTIYFKPVGPGMCTVSFIRQNNSKDETMSLYRFKTDDSTGKVTEVQEVVLFFKAKGTLGNGDVAYYSIEVTEADVLAGYKYAIGMSSENYRSGTSAGFIFLKLAGSDIHGGNVPITPPDGQEVRKLNQIAFVSNTAAATTEITMHRSVLDLDHDVTLGETAAVYFNVDIADNKVIYCNAAGLDIDELANATPLESKEVFTTEPFPPREDTLPTQ